MMRRKLFNFLKINIIAHLVPIGFALVAAGGGRGTGFGGGAGRRLGLVNEFAAYVTYGAHDGQYDIDDQPEEEKAQYEEEEK